MSKTPIEWTERTWNPVRGCNPVSPGCAHCYAEKTAGRFCGPGKPFDGFVQIGRNGQPGPHWTGKVELVEHMLDVPLRTRKPATWFVNSMSDLFHENLADDVIDRVFAVMALCPQHTFQVLTKRSKRMREYINGVHGAERYGDINEAARSAWLSVNSKVPGSYCGLAVLPTQRHGMVPDNWPLPNVWLGVSVEDRERMFRIEHLRQTPAEVRFLSIEPLLEDLGKLDLRGIDWVIVGGESGPGARPFNTDWARRIVRQCADAGVPVFVKQLGAHVIQGGERRRKKSRKGGDMHEWEHDLRVRQMPEVVERPRFVR